MKLDSSTPSVPPGPETPESAGGTAPLSAQFLGRLIHTSGETADERLTTSYWLNLPVVNEEDDANENELVSVR